VAARGAERPYLRKDVRMARQHGSGGFTLIEVVIAIIVVAIGVLAMFSLISTGMDASAKAVADTQGSIFADAVFNGFRANAAAASQQESRTNRTWTAFWDNISTATNMVAMPMAWVGGADMRIIADNAPHDLTFVNQPQRTTSIAGIPNFSLRYRLATAPIGPGAWKTHQLFLWVWPGRKTRAQDALRFYTEIPFGGNF
jgi:type IV pilus modification protein PilV